MAHQVSVIEVKGGKGKVSEPKFVAPEIQERAAAIEAALRGMLDIGGAEVKFYSCVKFKKIGDKGQAAALVTDLIEGADEKEIHIALSAERAGLKADDVGIADAAAIIAGQYVSKIAKLDADTRDGFGWVPAAAAIATAHLLLKDAKMSAPMGQREVSYADRYLSVALKDNVSVTTLGAVALRGNPLVRRLLRAREILTEKPVALPISIGDLAVAVRSALAEADSEVKAAA